MKKIAFYYVIMVLTFVKFFAAQWEMYVDLSSLAFVILPGALTYFIHWQDCRCHLYVVIISMVAGCTCTVASLISILSNIELPDSDLIYASISVALIPAFYACMIAILILQLHFSKQLIERS